MEQRESQQEGSRGVAEAGEEMETEVPGSEAPPDPWRRYFFWSCLDEMLWLSATRTLVSVLRIS